MLNQVHCMTFTGHCNLQLRSPDLDVLAYFVPAVNSLTQIKDQFKSKVSFKDFISSNGSHITTYTVLSVIKCNRNQQKSIKGKERERGGGGLREGQQREDAEENIENER